MELKNTVVTQEQKAEKIDRLGFLMAEVSPANKEIKAIKKWCDENLDDGERVNELSKLFDGLKSISNRKMVDRKTILELLKPSRQMLTAHTSQSRVVKILVTPKQS